MPAPLAIRRAALIGCLAAALAASASHADPADTLYFGGPILTMEGDAPRYAEALLVRDGRIAAVGERKATEAQAGDARRVDLQGKALLPGFIDAHGHVANAGFQKLSANMLPPPDGEGSDIPTLVALLKAWHASGSSPLVKTGWIIGFGYDDSQLAEKRHPTAAELDAVSTDVPVLIIHQSGHLGVLNHKALAMAGITAESVDPAGGLIRREADGKTPDGVLEEMALFRSLFGLLGSFDAATGEKMALAGLDAYTQFGFTTAQEGRSDKATAESWRRLAEAGRLPIDVAVYPDVQTTAEYIRERGTSRSYDRHFRIAGGKLSFDGSPQGKTAWLTEPYVVPPRGQPADYAGYPAIPDPAERQRLVDLAFANHWQLLVHCNGDAAADAMIAAVRAAEAKYGKDDRRTVMIHAQAVRLDQLEPMRELGITPSYFSMHTYYWGDWHREQTLGPERAAHISPTASTLKLGMRFTEHHDAPVALPSAMVIVHTTVNRTSRSGVLIGADERVSPYIGLKAITEWAAWQYFEEDSKGTLTPGKLADLVILDNDPTRVEPATIRDIRVLETIKEGKTVYRAP